METPTYGDYRLSSNRKVLKRKVFCPFRKITVILNKKPILQHLATPGFSLEREGPGKAYAATPKRLTYAKPERIDPNACVSTGLFLFWFVFSFCVFNLIHAFKSLALFPPSEKTVARYFGATSGLRVLCTRRPTQIRLRTKRKNEQEDFSHVHLSK